MGIERLKGSLISEAREEAQKITGAAREQANGITEAEDRKCLAMKKEAEASVKKLLDDLRGERIAWARLESKRITAEAREDAIKGALDGLFEALEASRKSPEYRKYMARSANDAVAELGAGATIHVVRGDKALLGQVKGAKIVEDLDSLGGVLAESADGKIRMNFTLETLFEGRRDEVRKQVHDLLFGGK
jgi:V/A-type H+-transporting ATPase subunit E